MWEYLLKFKMLISFYSCDSHLQYLFYAGIYNTNTLTYIQNDVSMFKIIHISVVCNIKRLEVT